ncbi:MAG: ion transporter [Pseudomonadota bacterium]|nr:ion transporter [Pseudomonadota bacterium]
MTCSATNLSPWRQRLACWIEQPGLQHLLIALILINAAVLGLETSPSIMAAWGSWLVAADRAILAIFVVEIILRLLAHRLAYFRDPWNVFDFLVVAIALVPASGPLAVLRALRVLRVLRLITLVPSMKRVVSGLLSALPGLGSVAAIIGLIFYVAAVIATKLFAADFPEWFGSLGASAFTLFQVMTLESWAMGIVRPVMAVYPAAWIFFLVFILASTFTLLNLFIAVIVNAIQSEGSAEVQDAADDDAQRLRAEMNELRAALLATQAMLVEKRKES